MPDKAHNQSTVTEWYRAGHFDNHDEAMGAFKLAYQQAIDGMGVDPLDWMGMTFIEYNAWMTVGVLPPLTQAGKASESDVGEVPIDPDLPADFDSTPNEQRPRSQIEQWWGVPFIRTCSWSEMSRTYESYCERLTSAGIEIKLSESDFASQEEETRQKWFESWPSGTRYEVRCLDGGAWDRSTSWGMVPTLEEAITIAKKGPPWGGSTAVWEPASSPA